METNALYIVYMLAYIMWLMLPIVLSNMLSLVFPNVHYLKSSCLILLVSIAIDFQTK